MIALTFAIACLGFAADSMGDDWLRFRGENGSGVSKEKDTLPTEFGDEKNLAWKKELPGAGASAPIVVGDKVIVTCYSGYGMSRQDVGQMNDLKRHVVCYDKKSGRKIWQKDFDSVLPEDPFQGMGVPEHGYASSSPISDGQYVFLFFGKTGVFALKLENGDQVWHKSVGTDSGPRAWGSGASLCMHDNVVIVNATDESGSLVGLNKSDGAEIWKNDEIFNVWGTPILVGEGDEAVLVFSVPGEVWGLNPKSGKIKWYNTNGVADSSVSTSPVVSDGIIVAMGGRSGTAVAIKTGGKKDNTESHTLWKGRSTGRIVSPVMLDGHIYGVSRGIATCLDAKTGEEVFQERLPSMSSRNARGSFGPSSDYNSPVAGDGKIYQFTKSGGCYVFAAKPKFELLATNKFEEDGTEFNSTPAISDGKLYVRSNKFLYCIGE